MVMEHPEKEPWNQVYNLKYECADVGPVRTRVPWACPLPALVEWRMEFYQVPGALRLGRSRGRNPREDAEDSKMPGETGLAAVSSPRKSTRNPLEALPASRGLLRCYATSVERTCPL